MSEKSNQSTDPEIDHEEEDRRRFEADVVSYQSNVLPLDAARNEGRFYGQIIRGERRLSSVQRIGFFLVGWLFCWWGIFLFMGAFPQAFGAIGLHISPIGDKHILVLHLPFAALALLLGLKVMVRAITPHKRRPQKTTD
ncbi:MAG: hypothetical protein WAL95_22210 [Candidatus Acidiferrales bacterium]